MEAGGIELRPKGSSSATPGWPWEYNNISVPIIIDVSDDGITVCPKSVLFYSDGDVTESGIRLSSNRLSLEVLSAVAEHKNIALSVCQGAKKGEHEVVAMW